MKKDEKVCGCCGPHRGVTHLIDLLERQKPPNQAEIETGEWPVMKPEQDTRPKPEGRSGCA